MFILAVLMNVFTYAYFSKKVAFTEGRYENIKEKLGDSLIQTQGELLDLKKFTLDGNFEAQYYFENLNTNDDAGLKALKNKVETALMAYNLEEEGNPYTGYPVLEGSKFEMEKILILNHRWILGDYSNGIYKGQVLLKYFIDTNEAVSFEMVQTYLYSTKL